ncbi:auxin-responsive protein SAUR71 isoform X2 [Cajanus cajan]|uniref:auxin-responsive protein SAUR71 isoform X2 n=1 Tax=Cajanus cajan TaxID=3821 RepID=UPI00098D9232|nr:auxin-responsive protein SAUR71 isoform X2 [Cajanus cajan]
MKHLIRRLSRVADSSAQYALLRSDSRRQQQQRCRRAPKIRRSSSAAVVPEGHVPIYVGDEMERFVVCAELLNHPVFVKLLNESAQEYGYEQKGVLRLPCCVLVFERVLHALRLGLDARDVAEIVGFSSEE